MGGAFVGALIAFLFVSSRARCRRSLGHELNHVIVALVQENQRDIGLRGMLNLGFEVQNECRLVIAPG
jgi:hypothetical protein